jgi:pyruvate/2-oxoglutarate/acetoin dehydrogenase E1 component
MNRPADSERQATVLTSLNQALHDLMVQEPRVLMMGEDILDPYGGAFKVTKGLSTRFPGRVFGTPLSEGAIVGMASGMAMRGLLPIVEIMFGDFLMLASDQLINHAAKFRWMYNDGVRVPMVVRTPMGGRRGYGPTHSQSLEKHFLGVPGLWVVAPHVAGDPGALLRQAVQDNDEPVLFIESKTCYPRQLITSGEGLEFQTLASSDSPFPTTYISHGKADGPSDALIFTYGGMTPQCLEAMQRLQEVEGLSVDVAVFSQLSPVPLDHIRRILEKPRPEVFVYVEEGSTTAGWASEMLARVTQLCSEHPDSVRPSHHRVGSQDLPIPSSRELEWQTLPQVEDIVSTVVDCF